MNESASGEASNRSTGGAKDSSVECPTCGQACKSKKGMRQHHKRAHDESVAKIQVACDWCGETHRRWKSQLGKENYYCSNECRLEALHDDHDPQTNKKTVECAHCGGGVKRRASRINRAEDIYCSRRCADKGHSQRMSGSGNPKWVGGHNSYYGENWRKQRDKARSRDDYACKRCGVTEREIGHELSVHHRVPFRKFTSPEQANQLDNLITLCRSCHGVVEAWPVHPQ